MIRGLSHITLVSRDLDRMAAILTSVFDAREIYSSGEETFSVAPEKFFLIGEVWVAVMQGDRERGRSYEHVAFRIDPAEIESYRDRIEALGLELRDPRPRVEGEGQSLYFYDDDDHLFELHAGTLEERLARYAKGMAA